MGKEVLTGEHFIHGDAACAEGGIAAGCRFFAGYPITPATEVAERMARRLPEVGGIYIQKWLSAWPEGYLRWAEFTSRWKMKLRRWQPSLGHPGVV